MRKLLLTFLTVLWMGVLIGCTSTSTPKEDAQPPDSPPPQAITNDGADNKEASPPPAIEWTATPMGSSSGVFYEIFVRSFYDSDGDGIGDLNGVTAKLDYLVELGIEGIWLMPINPSPSYHGYDVTDYYDIHPEYGTLADFKHLLEEAHQRGIKVIMDLVVNHSSSQHPWFIEAKQSPDSPYRDWYVWTDEPDQAKALGAWGQKAWHPYGGEHFLGIFWDGMPDLNLDHPEVREEFAKIGQYWLDFGVDGFRLDAAKHIYEDLQSHVGDADIAAKNHAWWQEFRTALDEVNPEAYVIGEVWDSISVIGPYLDNALDSAFNFDVAGQIVEAVKQEDAANLSSVLSRAHSFYSKHSAGTFVEALFLTNHDQNRVMSELRDNVDHAKMAASILLTLPGNPFIYYGEEIGMKGTKPDEKIREPMVWYREQDRERDRSLPGVTSWQRSLHQKDVISIEEQLEDPDSLLNHYKQMIQWRKEQHLLRDGSVLSSPVINLRVIDYVLADDEERILVLHNITGKTQQVELRASHFGVFEQLLLQSDPNASLTNQEVSLPPYSTVILK